MRGKALLGTVVVAFVAFAAGWYFGKSASQGPTRTSTKRTYRVVVIMKQDHSCQQIDSGAGGPAKLPQLSHKNGDDVIWLKGIDAGGNTAPLVVTFPQNSNGHVGSPFTKFVFNSGDDSGPAGAPPAVPYDVYLYESLTVGGIPCTNPQDPGVIIVQ